MSRRAREAWIMTLVICGLTALVLVYAFLISALMSVSVIAGVAVLVVSIILGTFGLCYKAGV